MPQFLQAFQTSKFFLFTSTWAKRRGPLQVKKDGEKVFRKRLKIEAEIIKIFDGFSTAFFKQNNRPIIYKFSGCDTIRQKCSGKLKL